MFIIIFAVLLLDSLAANLIAYGSGQKWYSKNFRTLSRAFPITKGWTTYYLILVLWLGFVMYSTDIL
ncbi:MAG: hypothetical protein COU11_00040 [Candidatus Harrisonbacteria bacterium CG10_big_fil_rev_8_21_14_0_10_49_15]|uniref:Uncharacterized protein n=1 Tax=Candidatus Harrisonbacteria bacterium CG10_big_fil_rev_8_21_14_0_10_49_15 TaxID=1974587 RepID=A0A2H0UPC2_9BACT|nr:MAG: hypothetical protein COU11_00040 [Candidatus Harrisonbacteria bacterium CG10_big_fil_rev_8_21_14_0_10_49_15]